MAFLVAFVAFVGSLAFFLWRLNIGIKAGRELHDEVRGFGRRFSWSRKATPMDRLVDITDPRESATVLMLGVARAEGDVTAAQRAAIQSQMVQEFAMTASAAEAMIAHCQWRTQGLTDITGRMRALLAPVFADCSDDERNNLRTMLQEVASAQSPPSPLQIQILEKYDQLCSERV